MEKNKNVTIILGSNSFLGREIIKDKEKKYLTGSSSSKKSNFRFRIGDDLDQILPKNIKIEKIIYLSWDRRNKIKNGENLNIVGLRKVIKFTNKYKIPIYFASSFSAISRKNNYGNLKYRAENLLKLNKKNKIFRIAMIYHGKGGLIFKINKIFKNLPFILLPNGGNFMINTVKLGSVVKAFNKKYKNDGKIIYVFDKTNQKFKELLNYKNKLIIPVPVFLIKSLLYVPYMLKIQNSSFNYDGFLSLINDPKKIVI